MRLTKEERRFLKDELRQVGGELVPVEVGFARGRQPPDIKQVKSDEDVIDFVGPKSPEGYPLRFEELGGNAIHEGLAKLDRRLTPNAGLRRLDPAGELSPLEDVLNDRTLLVVHGTFSNSRKIIGDLAKHNAPFLSWALEHYSGNVITFDYPTLSQQAIASAMSLHRQVNAHVRGPIDVISHSQGALVTRFWLEAFDRARLQETRAVFVAGALGGTSLAAPTALRRALCGLANFAWVLQTGMAVAAHTVPVFGVLSGMFALLEKTTKFLSGAPIADAGIAIVPGFNGMSQVATNVELRELQAMVTSIPERYFAVTGDFEPTGGGWKFWKSLISRNGECADHLLFKGPNDMVVDTPAMTHLADGKSIPAERVHHFPARESDVHHTNYFEQEATAKALRAWLAD